MKRNYVFITVFAFIAGKLYGDALALTPIGQAIADNNLVLVQDLINSEKVSIADSALQDEYVPLLSMAIRVYYEVEKKCHLFFLGTQAIRSIINFLLKKGAALEAYTSEKYSRATPLYAATYYDLPEIVTLLLKLGADVNAGNGFESIDVEKDLTYDEYLNNTALHEATRMNYVKIVKILLEHGANIYAKNSDGYTPYDMTIVHDNSEEDYVVVTNDRNGTKITPKDRAEIKKLFDDHNKKLAEQARLQKFREKQPDVKFSFE